MNGVIGQSDLTGFISCPRRHMYRHERGLIPKEQNSAMTMGTLWHAGAAEGYRAFAGGGDWLVAAQRAAQVVETDRDGMPLGLDDEKRLNVSDMLAYYWEHVGRHDKFDKILAIEEPMYLNVPRDDGSFEVMRGTLDLMVEMNGETVIIDHKTSSDIDADQGHLALDTQTHLYYVMAWANFGSIPLAFVHNFTRRFEEKDKLIIGPPSFRRENGEMPYAKSLSGKARTASDDPNDYVRRVRTPLSEQQLASYYKEIDAKLSLFEFCRNTDIWPRFDAKLGFGCKSCAYYSICTTELDGREVDPQMLDMVFKREPVNA